MADKYKRSQILSVKYHRTVMKTGDILSNLANLLPTGTYMVFQTLAPVTTNNGQCGSTEQAVTGIALFLFAFLCCLFTFTDSYVAEDNRLYYGIVTTKGLWNPVFEGSGLANVSGPIYEGNPKYNVKNTDIVTAFLSVIAFATLSLFTTPISTCFYPGVPGDLIKSVPILVGLGVSLIFVFTPPARNGVGFAYPCSSTVALASNPVAEFEEDFRNPL